MVKNRASLHNSKNKKQKTRKKIIIEDDDDDIDESIIEDYASNVLSPEEMYLKKNLLKNQVKTVENDVHEEEFVESEDNFIALNEENGVDKEDEEPKTFVGLYVKRKDTIKSVKELFAQIGHSVMSHPQENLHQLNRIITMLDTPTSDPEYGAAFFTIQKLAFQSMCVIFADIIPNYRVSERAPSQLNEKQNRQLQQQTIKLLHHEYSLLFYYNNFLLRIERIIKCLFGSKSNFYQTMLTTNVARLRLALIACQCLSNMLSNHYNFNSRTKLITLICEVICNKKHATPAMRTVCGNALINLFKVDRLGEVSLEVVNVLSKLIIRNDFRVSPLVFNSFCYLELAELANESAGMCKASENGGKKAKRELLSRTERKRNKKMKLLENQLLEAEAVESSQKRQTFKAEIHKKLFSIYFHYLKRCQEVAHLNSSNDESYIEQHFRPLFSFILKGVAKYSMYLNDNFVYNLIDSLRSLINIDTNTKKQIVTWLTSTERLQTIETIFTILSSAKNLLTIDFHTLYLILFQLCSDPAVYTKSMIPLINCLKEMLLKRFKVVSLTRLISFSNRLLLMCCYLSTPETIATLTIVRLIFQQNPTIFERLIDMEEVEHNTRNTLELLNTDPDNNSGGENSNAIYNLNLIIDGHYDPYVRYYAYTIMEHFRNVSNGRGGMFGTGVKYSKQNQLNQDICSMIITNGDAKFLYKYFNTMPLHKFLVR